MSEQFQENAFEKLHRMVNGEADCEAAIDEVIGSAQRSLHIFDADLTRGGYSSLKRYDALHDFLSRGRGNQLVLVLHETDYLTARCPRLMNLLRMQSHRMLVQKTQEHGRVAGDSFVIADEAHFVHRFHHDDARGLLAMNDHAGARQLEERFSQLLEASHPAVFATTLGL